MKLRTKYITFVSLTLLTFFALIALLYDYNKYLFLIGEGIIIITIILSILFFKSLIRPFKLLNSGIESIADKDFSIKFLPVGQPESDMLIEVYNKMIDQLRLERTKSTETHFFLEKLIESSPAGIIILDANNYIHTINPAARSLLKIKPDNNEIKLEDLASPWNAELAKLKPNMTTVIQENGVNQYKCIRSSFLDRGFKRTFFIIEEFTKELLHAEKKAYEKVIRMISHEVNNCMGSVNSIIDTTADYMNNENGDQARNLVDALSIAKNRISNLNHFTKRFAEVVRIPPPDLQDCDLAIVIKRLLVYFQEELTQSNIEVSINYKADEEKMVRFDPQQLELVLVNIIKNAIQAIQSDGRINIITHTSPFSLIIENNGTPIAEDVQSKLFTPFFTTKKEGQGIGLTIIREILMNHDCKFSLQTRSDGITEFKILF